MVRDQLDPKILDMDPEKSLRSQTESADDGPPLKDDPRYSKVCIAAAARCTYVAAYY